VSDIEKRTARRTLDAWFWAALAASALLTVMIAVLGPRLRTAFVLPVDEGSWFYAWQLAHPTFWSRFTAWTLYGLHQVSVWVIVALAMREKPHANRATAINVAFFAVNLVFSLLHILQTHLWYDGLAQDVPIWSSQYSVIVMLVLILFLMIPRRGIFLGLKVPLPERALAFVRRWHGLYISWALVYTFWFHPTEGVPSILTGFFYMFLLFTQMSVANTRWHFVVGWITVLELLVGLHGPAIALINTSHGWPMFLFGFLFMFVFTQQFGFKLPWWARALIFAAYAAGAVYVYGVLFAEEKGLRSLYQLAFIPAALYGGTFALVGLSWLFGRGTARAPKLDTGRGLGRP
jgi:hypothetical protein